ncbi:hypothetical protein B0H16DRAFT_1888204 [Mycena metata]|uniref:F-box domain-containing protein n=1 Tax=Mycena metata TaxID=1033252 RepID=A0AAD7IRP9_9AGAR|nr:hypothetical protein B0H16DRAFT_1888204 [Mycena metata]
MDFTSADIEPYSQFAPLGPFVGYQTSTVSSGFRLPMELWIKIVLKLLRDPKLSPSRIAAARAVVACVCKDWHVRVYAVPEFWTHITIYKNVTLARLDFVLAQCLNADLHIRLHLRDLKRVLGQPPNVWTTAMLVDTIFDRIGRTSSRWASFELCTENPLLSYIYMPGYFNYASPDIYDVPFQLHPWFLDDTPYIRNLRLFCSTIDWRVATAFSIRKHLFW